MAGFALPSLIQARLGCFFFNLILFLFCFLFSVSFKFAEVKRFLIPLALTVERPWKYSPVKSQLWLWRDEKRRNSEIDSYGQFFTLAHTWRLIPYYATYEQWHFSPKSDGYIVRCSTHCDCDVFFSTGTWRNTLELADATRDDDSRRFRCPPDTIWLSRLCFDWRLQTRITDKTTWLDLDLINWR